VEYFFGFWNDGKKLWIIGSSVYEIMLESTIQAWRKYETLYLYVTIFNFCKIITIEVIPLGKLNVIIC
jgi:hypothetical protein